MKSLAELLKEGKPNISESSIKTYSSLLRGLYHMKHEKGSQINPDWFNNQDEVMELLKDKVCSSRKTIYAALIAVTKDNDKYKKALMDDGKEYDKFIQKQEKTKTQEDNWEDYSKVREIYEAMYAKCKSLLNSKEPLNQKEFNTLQDFIILSLTSGYWIPPRRSLDWTALKIKNINKEKDNYIDKGHFIFQVYKTSKFYNEQTVEIPKGLKLILTKWIKLNPSEYLLADKPEADGKPLSNVRITQKLNKIFGKNISTSMLRHIFLSDKLKDLPKLEELQKLSKDMGHSISEQLEYIKH